MQYSITFDEAVSGLEMDDFAVAGTASGCTVVDADLVAGPVVLATAVVVRVDRTAPSVSMPVTRLRTGARADERQVPVSSSWPGLDGTGSGVAGYEVECSVD